jgi:hypothetical protein
MSLSQLSDVLLAGRPKQRPMCVSDNDNIPEVVEFGTDTYDCPTDVTFIPLPASSRKPNIELCNRRTKMTSLTFEAGDVRRGATRSSGRCRQMIVHMTDYMSYSFDVRILN